MNIVATVKAASNIANSQWSILCICLVVYVFEGLKIIIAQR
ncbi:hypothetical protein MKY88_10945 [Lysinibacillus sp. FSL R7-0073]|nr:hypothetical protein [Lysinibacillus fusiformis]